MNVTKKFNIDESKKKTVDTMELQAILGVGRKTAVEIGTSAQSKLVIGRRVIWNLNKVQKYLDSICE